MTSPTPQPDPGQAPDVRLDATAVLRELARMPQVELYLELAEERAARKQLQQQNAEQANTIARLESQPTEASPKESA